jgi:hypothetical protein
MATLYTARRSLVVARAVRVLLASTSATAVLQFQPHRRALYRVGGYGFVNSAATTLTLSRSWYDPDAPSSGTGANPQSDEWYSAANLAVGPFLVADKEMVAAGDQPITVTATAGTANNVTLTVFVERLAI